MFFDDLEKCFSFTTEIPSRSQDSLSKTRSPLHDWSIPVNTNNQFIYDKGLVLMHGSSSFGGISLSQTHKKSFNIKRQLMLYHLYSVFITIYTFHTCISKEPRRTPIYTWSVNVMARFGIEAMTTCFCASWTVRLVTF